MAIHRSAAIDPDHVRGGPRTRVSFNQAPPIPDHDAWQVDASSRWWLEHLVGGATAADLDRLSAVGRAVGSQRLRDAADRANRNDPQLVAWDRWGNRIDDVAFDPAWDEVLHAVTSSGVCGLPWLEPDRGYLVRAAAMELWARLDIGVMCPVTMTGATVPVLQRDPDGAGGALATRILEAAAAGLGDGHPLVGMAMTEPQGGSDLSATSTTATPLGDGTWRLDGHKWFVSHAVADALLVLAREPDGTDGIGPGSRGLSCFLVPGWLPDGSRNGLELQRLKDKLGTRSLASAEVVLDGALATRIGEAGRGVPTIIEMVVHTRMDCVLGNAGILARAVGEAVNHVRGRAAFGAPLVEQPLMRMVLADLLLEREAALALAYEVARGFQVGDPVGRLVTAVAKYWVTRRAVTGCIECVETMGGNGYTEEFPVARLYRDAQVNSTWEGSGNVMALDVLRALAREPSLLAGSRARVVSLLEDAHDGVARDVARFAAGIESPAGEADGRRFAGRLALALQAALLAHRAAATGSDDDRLVAEAFVATRLEASPERVFGDGDDRLAAAASVLLARAPLPPA